MAKQKDGQENKPANTAAKSQPELLDRIREAAYHIYIKRGGTHGMDMSDWLEAEKQVLGKK